MIYLGLFVWSFHVFSLEGLRTNVLDLGCRKLQMVTNKTPSEEVFKGLEGEVSYLQMGHKVKPRLFSSETGKLRSLVI